MHAQGGLRHLYRPLAHFGDGQGSPLTVVAAYLNLAPFKTLYLADLDALTGGAPQWDLVESLAEKFPKLSFWVDAAASPPPPGLHGRITIIVGSETKPQGLDEALEEDVILSLDYRGDTLMGGAETLARSDFWPNRAILMSLSRVGGLGGPDFQKLRAFRVAHPEKQLFAAGGVRSEQDLNDLASLGVSGVLLATALQTGAIGKEACRRFMWSGVDL